MWLLETPLRIVTNGTILIAWNYRMPNAILANIMSRGYTKKRYKKQQICASRTRTVWVLQEMTWDTSLESILLYLMIRKRMSFGGALMGTM